ncbi:surface antigen Bsp, putative [Trichomonas vaginalis G3]|uniref:Surface antigen Bsp, putative n=1 Tax=Trichomonas vaginalis (strain ATCC PRA-98 / G3) TaxID=412133 RepID=A2FGH2_TRIV3|nr:ribonuclease inhibitor domain-containing protein [Trichomonas vaginalis G3]EAX95986.1 surface antigen Bsp, putative [Trichomonas vaginalis G3]KAI5537686.1 ribonuclease inhibitor domain-containing protein [Trichomonas vaginalis G3]|eukprot:XP_001308916.1 surface antigen Bsp [Trichomonas vaginalis G3]
MAFQGCTNLSKFSFGNHIIEIGTSAFENAILNSEIAFPATLTKISNTAFKNCKKIPSISFSSSSSLQILDSAFENCISITSIIFITNTETTLGSSCFSNLTSLNSIQISNNIKSVGSACFSNSGLSRVDFFNNNISFDSLSPSIFRGCINLRSFTIPSNRITIGTSALSGTSIEHLDIPDSVETFDGYCFSFCTKLVSINIKNSSHLENIRLGVFQGCTNFATINEFISSNFVCESGALYSSDRNRMHVYPPASTRRYFYLLEGVVSIEDSAFIGCTHLESILLPEKSLFKIGQSSFEGCINLRHITIPSSIVSIGENAFLNCPSLNCGALIQNRENKTFIRLLKQSGLDISSSLYCSGFSCEANIHSNLHLRITETAVMILM